MLTRLGRIIRAALASPAGRTFALIWLLATAYLILTGRAAFVWSTLPFGAGILLFSLLTVLLTEADPARPRPQPRRLLRLQLLVLAVIILLTAYDGLVFHRVLPAEPGIPLWTPLRQSLESLSGRLLGEDFALPHALFYVIIPFVLLVLLGARRVELGFRRGHRVLPMLALWCGIPLLILLLNLISGPLTLQRIISRLYSNTLQNGFLEEFLFRGALQTRLRSWMTPGWALILQALAFGAWHLGLGFSNTGGGDPLAALASTLVSQAVLGLGFGLIFARTRNLLVPSVFHVLFNSLG